jgi:CO/xanthine dehydrogenase Mo-binding subunit
MPLDNKPDAARKFNVVGTRPNRPDGIDKVTGRARFGADATAPGMLVGKILRSPHAHARIRKIDTSKVEKLPGVKAVVTRDDFPDHTKGDAALFDVLYNVMAREKALYEGHAVAAVAAISENVARQALKLIKIDYEVLPHVTDVDEAMKPNAPVLHPKMFTEGVEPKPRKPSNIVKRHEFGHGDVAAGFRQADHIIERSFKTAATHQGYIEPHACLANVGPDGQGELWVCTQGHFMVRNFCAQLLGMDISKLRVTASEIGGGFGGKTTVFIEPVALALSRKANRPVKVVMSRDEVFKASGPTASTSIDVKLGFKKDGTITAADATLRYQGGAFPGAASDFGAMTAFACYDLKNVRTIAYDVVTNRPKLAAYRAPSAPMAAFAVESVMEEAAHKVGMAPIDFRIKNAAREGTKASYGPTYGPIGLSATLEAAKKHAHFRAPLGKNQGRGMACGFWFNFGGQTAVSLNINLDGTVALSLGTPDIGGSRASMCLMAAEELGIPYEQVRAIVTDTSSLGYNDVTDGSRVTFAAGMATIHAARDAIKLCTCGPDVGHPGGRRHLGERQRQARGRQRRQFPAAIPEGDRGRGRQHRRSHRRPSRMRGRRCRGQLRDPHLRRRAGSRDRGHQDHALHGAAGCRQGDPSLLRRGPVPGRSGPGHRLGAQRGIHLWRRWPAAERRLSRLQDPRLLRPADDRHGDPGDPQSRASLRGARRGRDLDRAAVGGDRQRSLGGGRCAHDGTANLAAQAAEGDVGQARPLSAGSGRGDKALGQGRRLGLVEAPYGRPFERGRRGGDDPGIAGLAG